MTDPSDGGLDRRLRELMVEELELDIGPGEIPLDHPLQSPPFSLDSMAYARFLVVLEDEFDIRIADDEAGRILFETLRDVIEFVRRRRGEAS